MNSDDSFAVKRLAGSSFRYSYFHDSDVWGLWVMTSSHSGDDKILTQTQIKHERRNFSIGVARRFFFPADPLTYFGQSFVNLSLGIESSYHTYSANDGFLISEAKDTSTQAIADLAYSLPIINNFWLELALGYRADQFTLKIDNRNIPYRSSTYSKLGVAYAF